MICSKSLQRRKSRPVRRTWREAAGICNSRANLLQRSESFYNFSYVLAQRPKLGAKICKHCEIGFALLPTAMQIEAVNVLLTHKHVKEPVREKPEYVRLEEKLVLAVGLPSALLRFRLLMTSRGY